MAVYLKIVIILMVDYSIKSELCLIVCECIGIHVQVCVVIRRSKETTFNQPDQCTGILAGIYRTVLPFISNFINRVRR